MNKHGILTSEIAPPVLDQEVLSQRFAAYKISYQGIGHDLLKTRKPKIAADIHSSGPVLALADYGKERAYFAILSQGEELKYSAEDVAVKPISFSEVPVFIAPKLLLMAMPRLLNSSDSLRQKRMNADGLYYLVDLKPIGGVRTEKKMLITAGCDVQPDWLFTNEQNRPVHNNLSISCASFKPIEQVTFEDGRLSKKHQVKPRYNLDEWGQIVSRDAYGEYIKESFDGSRNHVDAVDISNEDLEAFELSRVGVLGQCLEDIREVYGESFKIQLKRIPYDIHEYISDSQVRKAYDRIWEVMRPIPVNIIDTTGDLRALEILKNRLDFDRFSFDVSDEPKAGHSNILLVYPPEVYQADNTDDLYKVVKSKYRGMAIQACFPESLINAERSGRGKKNSVFEVLIKELLIKHEVSQREFLLDGFSIPEGAKFVYPVSSGKGRERVWKFFSLSYSSGKLQFDTLSGSDIKNIEECLTPEHSRYLIGNQWGTGERYPFIFWPETEDYMFFVESSTVALPEFHEMKKIMVQLQDERSQPIDREFLEIYCDDHPDSQLTEVCRGLLSELPDASEFNYCQISDGVRKKKIPNRSKDKESFYQWVESELGLLWKRSLKQKQDRFMDANLGFFFNREEGAYYVGAKGSPQQTVANFSKIYRLATTLPQIPDSVLNLFKVVHIRHRQMTVYPYPFKHLKEYSKVLSES